MTQINVRSKYFNIADTLTCGQVFRFKPYNQGFLVMSSQKACYVETKGDVTSIYCEESDKDYFTHYFDLDRDYQQIFENAQSQNIPILTQASNDGKGIRILNQDKIETLFSFIISQNNNIPRIKGIIEKLCQNLGEEKSFMGERYYTFPSPTKMSTQPLSFYKEIGLGYRAEYVYKLATDIANGLDVYEFDKLPTKALRARLIDIYGVGPKVADCVVFFGYNRTDSFPVDTWIEKVYVEDFGGKLKDRAKMSDYFVERFGNFAGYFQQYLFHYKRLKEK